MPTRFPKRLELVRARLTADERGRWTAALEPGETLSSLVRAAVDRELDRRQEAQAREVERQVADRFGFEEILRRARRGA